MYAFRKVGFNCISATMAIGLVVGQSSHPHFLTPTSLAVASGSPQIEMNCTQAYTTLGPDDSPNATAIVCKSADEPKATLCSPQSCYHSTTCHECHKIVTNKNNEEEVTDVFYDKVVCEKDYYLGNRLTEETMDSLCQDAKFETYVCHGKCVGFARCHNCTEVFDSKHANETDI